ERDATPRNVLALGELAGAVLLGLLPHEERRDARLRAHHGRDRYAAELEPTEELGALGDQVDHLRRHAVEEARVSLEEVLVEVLVRHLPGSQGELPAQTAGGVDVGVESGVWRRG